MSTKINNFLKGTKVLITGGMGFIGSNLALRCLDFGALVTIVDNLDKYSGGNASNIIGYEKNIDINIISILETERLIRCVAKQELIINCAASTSHGLSMQNPERDCEVNCRGTLNLLEVIRKTNIDARLVHIGTSTQFGKLIYRPADEFHPEFPLDIYSANKTISEKYVLIYSLAYGCKATVVRLPNVYGPRATICSPNFTFNNYFIGLALQNKPISVYGSGDQLRNVLYIDDAVNAILTIASESTSIGNVYLAAHNEHFSISDIAEETVKCIGSGKVNYIPWPREKKAIEIGDAVLSNNKISKDFGWYPQFELQKGLSITKEFYSSRLHLYLR